MGWCKFGRVWDCCVLIALAAYILYWIGFFNLGKSYFLFHDRYFHDVIFMYESI